MKVELILPQGGFDAEIVAFDTEGKKIDVSISRLEISPVFYQSKQVPPVLFGRVLSGKKKSKESHRFVVSLSGTKGRCRLDSRSNPVVPAYDLLTDGNGTEPAKKTEAGKKPLKPSDME